MNDQARDDSEFRPLNLWNDLQAMLNLCESDRQSYWESRADMLLVEPFLKQMEQFASAILQGTSDLVSADTFGEPPEKFWREWETHFDGFEELWGKVTKNMAQKGQPFPDDAVRQLREIIKSVAADRMTEPPPVDLLELRAVWEQLAINLAYEATGSMIEEAATKLLCLAGYVVTAKPGKPTVQFLRRVSRCFVWGFDSECVVFCRGAIDTGFRDAVADKACRKYGQPAARYGFTLAQRIQTAVREGIIDAKAEKAARLVNVRATKSLS